MVVVSQENSGGGRWISSAVAFRCEQDSLIWHEPLTAIINLDESACCGELYSGIGEGVGDVHDERVEVAEQSKSLSRKEEPLPFGEI